MNARSMFPYLSVGKMQTLSSEVPDGPGVAVAGHRFPPYCCGGLEGCISRLPLSDYMLFMEYFTLRRLLGGGMTEEKTKQAHFLEELKR